jgi:hypothetical protein
VDPVPDPLLLRNLVAPGIEAGTSGSVARNSDHKTTEAVTMSQAVIKMKPLYMPLKIYDINCCCQIQQPMMTFYRS